MVNRRNMLLSAIFTTPLVACGVFNQGSVKQDVQLAVQDALLAVGGLQAMLPQLVQTNPGLIPQPTLDKITADLGQAQASLNQLQANLANPNMDTLQQVETNINEVLNQLAALPVPAPYNQIIVSAAVLLPAIEAYLNQQLQPQSPPAQARMSVRTREMTHHETPEQARHRLSQAMRTGH